MTVFLVRKTVMGALSGACSGASAGMGAAWCSAAFEAIDQIVELALDQSPDYDMPERVARIVVAGITGGGSGSVNVAAKLGMIRGGAVHVTDYGVQTYGALTSDAAINSLSDTFRDVSDLNSYRTSIDGWKHFGSACTP